MSNVIGSRQFGRQVEVEIRDFKSQSRTVIGNQFEIDFEYFKSLDQVKEDDSGKIRIYGLNPVTIQDLQQGGGEVLLRCNYEGAEPTLLFHAHIVRMYAEVSDNTTLTTIECSANLLNYYQTGTTSPAENSTSGAMSFLDFFLQLGKNIGAKATRVAVQNEDSLSAEFLVELGDFVRTGKVKSTFIGSYQELLEGATATFGMAYNKIPLDEGGFAAEFLFTDAGIEIVSNKIKNGYIKVPQAAPTNSSETTNPSNDESFVILKNSQTAADEDRSVILLDEKSGLISVKIEYKIATAYADQELFDYEVETFKSQEDRLTQQAKLKEREAKEQEKVIKAAAKGKVYTPKKGNYKTTIKINRKYARVKALLNPNVKPQGLVGVPENLSLLRSTGAPVSVFDMDGVDVEDIGGEAEFQAILRVRNVTFKGNNKRNDWIMDIYAEDVNSGQKIDEISLNELERTSSPDTVSSQEESFEE